MTKIDAFAGDFAWLSNFHPAVVKLDLVPYPSVENAYQAAKFVRLQDRGYFRTCTPAQAKRYGRTATLPTNWSQRRVDIMRILLERKFAVGTPLAKALMATGDAVLIEGNHWGDVFWGVCRGVGANTLGQLLMERRKQLMGVQC